MQEAPTPISSACTGAGLPDGTGYCRGGPGRQPLRSDNRAHDRSGGDTSNSQLIGWLGRALKHRTGQQQSQ